MPVTLKCAACGAEVEFTDLSATEEATCPGCAVRVRYREGDQQMAMPVSMSLPETFRHVDLKSVAGKSSLLVGRYRKTPPKGPGGDGPSSDLVLAKALETLANSIGHLEDRLDRKTQGEAKPPVAEPLAVTPVDENGAAGVPTLLHEAADAAVPATGAEEVVQLVTEGETTAPPPQRPGKATPVGARVLVRREAAREAHEFRREKHVQADWDERGERARRPVGFAWLMDRFPKSTIVVTMVCAAALILWTIMAMDDMFTTEKKQEVKTVKTRTTTLSRYFDDDPEAAQAEIMARGYLNATSAEAAAPFVFESEAIREQFDKYYAPIATPGEYELSLKSRALTPEGQSVFAYNVLVPGEQARRLVVLPEGNHPKVYRQFFAEVGDLSWAEFLEKRPEEEVEMRVWIHAGEDYFEPYNPGEWQCYILHDWAEKRKFYAYANRGTSEDWRLADAFENDPVKFNRHSAVMALVKVRYMGELPGTETGEALFGELREVVATSWLPQRFRSPKSAGKK